MPYPDLGSYLVKARLASGIADQGELARQLGVAQQTISRWEKGTSRPKQIQIGDVASILGCSPDELNSLAGYAPVFPQQNSLDKPWPLDALSEVSFENICADLLQLLYKDADVHRYGSKGHKQDGLDIEAIFPNGTVHTFQCKRHASFGPKKIEAAVLAHSKPATKKFIVLSCVASPQAREKIKQYPDWELWDAEEVSRIIRLQLCKSDQITLAEIYFPTHRFALTGALEPSVWLSADSFFSGLLRPEISFSHLWLLVGREAQLQEALDAIEDTKTVSIFIEGSGGAGKSRLLREITVLTTEKSSGRWIRYLSSDLLNQKGIESLPAGPKLLICDDAHDRDDLRLLFSYASNPANQTKLVIAYRRYGNKLVTQQAAVLPECETKFIDLPKMLRADSAKLARQALQRFGGDVALADRIASLTSDCPLATVLGAQIASAKNSNPEFLQNEDSFRFTMMSRLVNTIADDVSSGLLRTNVESVLSVIALIQPIPENDPTTMEVIANVAEVRSLELSQIVRRLKDAGVLVVRGEIVRISPDLLGDFLVENACITKTNQSTGFAERVFEAVPDIFSEHVLVNVGRLDWIKSNGNTRQSHVLDQLWCRVDNKDDERYLSLFARTPLAFYQPAHALRFVERWINDGIQSEHLALIIRNITFEAEYLPRCCDLLWKLGQNDARPTSATPSHPVRVLSELAAPGPHNGIETIKTVVEFGIELIPNEKNWSSNHTPLTILSNALNTEGYTSTSTHRAVTMQPFQVLAENMKSIRRKVVDACIQLLSHPNPARGYLAAELLKKSVQRPMGMFNSTPTNEQRDQWQEEFVETLESIYRGIKNIRISPIVFNRLAKAVSWHAQFAEGITSAPARKIVAIQKPDIHTRSVNFLMSTWETALAPAGAEYSIEQRQNALVDFANELLTTFTDPITLHDYLKKNLDDINLASSGQDQYSFGLIHTILSRSPEFAEVLVGQAMFTNGATMSPYVGTGLAVLLHESPVVAHRYVSKAFDEQVESAVLHVAIAYSRFLPKGQFTQFDIDSIKILVESTSENVVKMAAGALGNLAQKNRGAALNLVGSINFEVSEAAADEHLMWLSSNQALMIENLSPAQSEKILKRLVPLYSVEGYWIKEFVRKMFIKDAQSVLAFFMDRVLYSSTVGKQEYMPIPFDNYPGQKFKLTDVPNCAEAIRGLLEQARLHSDDILFCYHFAKLLELLCAPYDANVLSILENFFDLGNANEINLLLTIIGEAPNDFVFSNVKFVKRFLVNAKAFGPELLERSISVLFQCGVSGIRSGVPGEPFSQDERLRKRAEDVLSTTGRFEPAYQLYSELLKYAEKEIEREKREGRIYDEVEE